MFLGRVQQELEKVSRTEAPFDQLLISATSATPENRGSRTSFVQPRFSA